MTSTTHTSPLAPIVVFVYNRPAHTLQTLQALAANREAAGSDLYIYADGAKAGASQEDLDRIAQTRAVIRQQQWCGNVHIVESASNKGLAASVIEGTTAVVRKHGSVITLEDDVVAGRFFLKYMNRALHKYANTQNVYMIAGYIFPVKKIARSNRSFFLPLTTTQAWGTWERAWNSFDTKATGYEALKTDAALRNSFNLDGNFDYTSMLVEQMESDRISSWAIRWWWSVFRQKGLVLYPDKSLVKNTGWDNSGTHSGGENPFEEKDWEEGYEITHFPKAVKADSKKFSQLKKYLYAAFNSPKKGLLEKNINRLKGFIKGRKK
ncbi:glycosyltransferase family 2 protein [Ferruginibacter sp. HRS2-29]|uniref:glycosyltransferase family 2 protein n=1 Tax=Ferruginibacter sp. HRS2-29 TaxID=2487334 RepID=UPI0020CCDF8D|nr:hypothetical protein [Ferruginibacter sp. HRS2-29]MCP9751943.1 glycosyltransferase [Ferruginibacter sp. HRS2-29]